LALTVASITLMLIVGEVIARFRWREPSKTMVERQQLDQADLPILRTLQDIARPNVRGIYGGVFFRTNRIGLRGPEYSRRPPKGVFRIAITGDSVTMGQGVDETDAYPKQLESLLNMEAGKAGYEVLNVGLSGANIGFAIQRLQRAVKAYEPHLIVYGFTINDVEGPAYRELKSPEVGARLVQRYKRFENSPLYLLRTLWPRWVSLRELFSPTLGSYGHELRINYFENPEAWGDFTEMLDRFAALGRERSVCSHVLIHTHLIKLDAFHPWQRIYDRVAEAALERDLTVTPSFSSFEGRDPAKLRRSVWDTHPNRTGHELMAQALFGGLRQLPESCWKIQPAGPQADG
jgi:lysophospholipase L1-like esterase